MTFVDIGGFTAMINIPELSWRRINHPADAGGLHSLPPLPRRPGLRRASRMLAGQPCGVATAQPKAQGLADHAQDHSASHFQARGSTADMRRREPSAAVGPVALIIK
nr:hypothetical protein OG781_02810 [Streptomyces sp. NBC_00830]